MALDPNAANIFELMKDQVRTENSLKFNKISFPQKLPPPWVNIAP
jgi:hypothetical protein